MRGKCNFGLSKTFATSLISLLGLLALSLASPPVRAAQFSGDYLLAMCASDETGHELTNGGHIACQAYISGVIDYHNLIRSLGTAPGVDFCIPEDTGLDTVQKQVTAYLLKHKKQHGAFVASPAVALALLAYYPCQKPQ